MNKLKAEISDIQSNGDLSLISLICEGEKFSSIMIKTDEDYVKKGNFIFMVFKETEVSIGKELSGKISIRNRFKSRIKSIDKGLILTEIKLDFKGMEITSIITSTSCENLDLKTGQEVEGLLKTNELFLMRYE